jgi:hypothetical protein
MARAARVLPFHFFYGALTGRLTPNGTNFVRIELRALLAVTTVFIRETLTRLARIIHTNKPEAAGLVWQPEA